MAGKVLDAEENLKIGNNFNSHTVKNSSTKSILSYQNGSALNVEGGECTAEDGMPGDGYSEETSMSEDPFPEEQNLKSECLDKLRKKLISDLSLTVFSTDLENKLTKMEPIEISKERQSVIQKLVVQISQLSDAEKLLLYLKLPSSTSSSFDPLRQPLNPLGNRQEIQQTIVWIKTHLEEDSEISIPKQDVYDQYLKYCDNVSMKPLSTADFGKVMKQVYPGVRPRRLGTRGNSRYCYSGMRNTCKLPTPILPQSSNESSVSNGSASDGSSSLPAEPNKFKKVEKTKRKWKSFTSRKEKSPTSGRFYLESEKDGISPLKSAKRLKVEADESESGEVKGDECSKEIKPENLEKTNELDMGDNKCEESSDNSFNAFDCNDFGIYLGNSEKGDESSSRSRPIGSSPPEPDDKGSNIQKISFQHGGATQQLLQQSSEKSPFASINGDQKKKENGQEGLKNTAFDQPRPTKGRTKKSSCKTSKNFNKGYVPIQPKPVKTPKLNVLLEQPMAQLVAEKKEPEGLSFCEESDSQEPEEEIVRYFRHLDEKEMSAVDQAVKNIESSSVQISHMSQMVSKNLATNQDSDEKLNQTTQQISRSKSCLGVSRGLFNVAEHNETVYVPRSQSSVELPVLTDRSGSEPYDSDSGANGKKKTISHLRILLEKSMTKTIYTGIKEVSSPCIPMMSNAQINHPVNSNGSSFLLSNVKPVERDFSKINNFKIVSRGSSCVPQSPNTRTKSFSFTPISPGPQSPLRTPTTPCASPFVSPRNTPVPRSKANSHDFFLPPSERKSTCFRSDGGKCELSQDNFFNFSKALSGSQKIEGKKPPTYLQACRPRSYSSTNFCRTKARRNSAKMTSFDRRIGSVQKNQIPAAAQINFSPNTQIPVQSDYVSSDFLSNEVKKFLENNSKLPEDQSAMIRSQSVPLNRMISESTWMPVQASPVFSGYYSSGTSNPTLASVSGKVSDWMTNSDTNSPEEMAANVSPFIGNGEIPNPLPPDSFSNEMFPSDPTVHLNVQYFPGAFPSGSDENFSENEPFRIESTFPNKLDLNSSGNFDSPFVGDGDPANAETIKSYLPYFEGLDKKDMEGSGAIGEDVPPDRKFFKNVLYEGGNDNLKDPVITSFRPALMNEMSSFPGSPVLNFFNAKIDESQPLIELFDFEN